MAPSQRASVEFAAARFGTRLVVVLGHSQCGAIHATVEELQQPPERRSVNLRSLVDRVRPSVEGLLRTELRHDPGALVHHAEGLLVVGASYSLETGVVEFFDSPGGA